MTSPTRSTLDTLKAARALIADPATWTTHAYARDEAHRQVAPSAPSACKFCALGAILAVAGADQDDYVPGEVPAIAALQESCGLGDAPANVNDFQGHEATLALYDRAIAAESAR